MKVLRNVAELVAVPFVAAALITILLAAIIGDWLHWLFWRTIGAVWITLSVRWEFRNFGYKYTGLRLIKWMILGK